MGGDVANMYNAIVKGEAPQPNAPPVPAMGNNQQAADDAAAQQRKPKGAAATLFAGKYGGTGGPLSPTNGSSQRMLLGS